MYEALSLISKIHEKGNRFIIEQLEQSGAGGLVPSHGDILAVLYSSGASTMKEIANRIHRTKPTVTVLVDKLEKMGYLKREKSEEDSRKTLISLTRKGEQFKPVFEDISVKLNKMLYKNLKPEEAVKLDRILKKMV